MKQATVNLYYDRRKGVNTLKLLLGFKRKQRQYTTGFQVDPKTWERLKANAFKPNPDGKIKDEEFLQIWHKLFSPDTNKPGYAIFAQRITNQLGSNFTFDRFKELLDQYGKEEEKPLDQTDLIAAIITTSKEMKRANRIGNASNYNLAAKSLQRFIDSFNPEERKEFLNMPLPRRGSINKQKAVLRFEHLTPEFLQTYEQWMLAQGKAPQSAQKSPTGASLTTVGIYLRHVRAVVNSAIEKGILSQEDYPFSRNRYTIPAGRNVKKALPKSDIDKIKSYQPEPGTYEQRGHDLWLFSYFCNGANLTDICRLTWSNIDLQEGKVTFIRKKTARSKKQNQTNIVAYLRQEDVRIIERWATSDRKPEDFVFPFLSPEMDETQKIKAIQQVIKLTNKWMRKIATKLGIKGNVNTYAARHSFATTLLKSEAPLAFISKSLGHTNIQTTEAYLGSFDDEEAKKFLKAL